MKTEIKKLEAMYACNEALEWLRGQPDPETAWNTCPRGDWMLWLIGKFAGEPDSPERRKLARTAAECAELVLPIYEAVYPDDDRPRKAIEAAKRGDLDECCAAANAAYTAAYAAAAYAAYAAAAYAAYAAAYAAYAAYAAAYTAADAADATADAAADDVAAAKCADVVRKNYAIADVYEMVEVSR